MIKYSCYVHHFGGKKMKKILIALFALLMLSGCTLGDYIRSSSAKEESSTQEEGPNRSEMLIDIFESNDFPYNEIKEMKMKKVIKTEFMNFEIKSVEKTKEFGDGADKIFADEGNDLWVVDVEVENTFREAIPVGNFDWGIMYIENEENTLNFPSSEITSFSEQFKMYPDEVELGTKEKVAGKVVFSISEEATVITFVYFEMYSNEDPGIFYIVPLD